MTEHHRLCSKDASRAGVLLMKSLRSDDEKSVDRASERASERAEVLPFPVANSLVGVIDHPARPVGAWPIRTIGRPNDRPEERPPNSDVVAESFPLLGRTWPFLYPSAPCASVRPSVRHKAVWTLASIVISTEGRTGMDGRREGGEGGEGGWGHFGNGRTKAAGALDATLLITKLPTLANMGNVAVVCKAGVTGGGGRAASSPASLPPPTTKRRRH